MKRKQRIFELHGRIFYSMMDMARELGVPRIYPRDFIKYGIKEVDGATVDKTVVVGRALDNADVNATEAAESTKVITKVIIKTVTIDNLSSYAKFLRKKTLDELIKLGRDAGVDTWDFISHESIRKMRIIMELKAKMFPGDRLETKKPTLFRKIPFNILVTTAEKLHLEHRKSDNDAIARMWITKALEDAGVDPKDLLQKSESS